MFPKQEERVGEIRKLWILRCASVNNDQDVKSKITRLQDYGVFRMT